MRTGMGWMCRELCRWEVRGTSGMVRTFMSIFCVQVSQIG